MKQALRAADVEALLREIQRYLAYVNAFRSAAAAENAPNEEKESRIDRQALPRSTDEEKEDLR